MRIPLDSVKRAARCKAPYTAVTFLDGDDPGRMVLSSAMLRGIVACEFLKHAEITQDGKLKLSGRNGHRRAEYLLIPTRGPLWTVKEFQTRWAKSQRKRRDTLALLPADRAQRRNAEAAAKLERKLKKIGPATPPPNPVLWTRNAYFADYQNHDRADAERWYAERSKRVALAKIAAQHINKTLRPKWAEIYTACEAIGCRIDSLRLASGLATRRRVS